MGNNKRNLASSPVLLQKRKTRVFLVKESKGACLLLEWSKSDDAANDGAIPSKGHGAETGLDRAEY
jgi:hypothetical protein